MLPRRGTCACFWGGWLATEEKKDVPVEGTPDVKALSARGPPETCKELSIAGTVWLSCARRDDGETTVGRVR